MNKTKLSQKEIAVSVLLFIFGVALQALLIFLMLLLRNYVRNGTGDFVKILYDNREVIITVSIALVVIFVLTYFYLFFENKNLLASGRKITELFLLIFVCYTICAVMDMQDDDLSMARPLLLFALLAGKLCKRKDAIFLNTIFAFVLVLNRYLTLLVEETSAFIGDFQVELVIRLLIIFCGGIVAIFMIQRVKTRMGSVMVTFVLFIPVITLNMAMQLPYIETGIWEKAGEILLYSALNCIFSMLLFMFLLPVFEWIFAELTTFRLRELTSDSSKLIKKLKENASGTYNHSIVVAQLAESCAIAINEDAELARAAAYYHDIGKLKNPEMFTENQSGYNMHNELTPELSVDIIRSHARDGARLIKSHHLPEIFADVALQHHGTMPIKYFYAKALKLSDGTLNPVNYSYMGPTPTSKIAAIIMICDASEAAARSLSDRSPEKVEALVKSLVEERMNMDQFVDCDITLKELSVIIRTLVNNLTGVYHERIAYPKLVLTKHQK
ncbi:MAG: HDIG domain-containing protein [Clostridiales bacterium]|nr:HDIG domain-containing protein [Clostridiales bacterium]